MHKSVNGLFIFIYYVLVLLPIIYVAVSIFSYYSVLNSFGEVPGNDTLYYLARTKNIRINTFPTHMGETLIIVLMYAYLFVPIFIFINYVVSKEFIDKRIIRFQKHAALILIGVYLIVYFLQWTDSVGWYFQYVLD